MKFCASYQVWRSQTVLCFVIANFCQLLNDFDVRGKAVYSHQTHLEINLSALSNGIYFIYAQTENGEISKSKLVVSK
jgi:hypothetical protein